MRKAIALVLLIVLGTMPLQTSAQVSVPAVDLYCTNLDGNLQTGDLQQEDDGNNSTSAETSSFVDEGPLGWIDAWGPELEDIVNCTISNPNTYAERIQIQVSADGLVVSAPGSIDLGPGGEESFNVTVRADQRMAPGIRTLTITATVVEANGVPPATLAESEVVGDIYLSMNYKDYGYNGCATFGENGIPNWGQWETELITMNIHHIISNDTENTTLEGNVTLRLNRSAAPLHSQNFFTLSMMGCFDDMPVHRALDYLFRSGDFVDGDGFDTAHASFWTGYCNGETTDENGTNYSAYTCPINQWSIPGEFGDLYSGPGSLVASFAGGYLKEMGDNVTNVSRSSMFDIYSSTWNGTLANPNLGADCDSANCYTVFGEVVKGQDFVDYIAGVETTSAIAPLHDVIIKEVYREEITDTDGDGTPDVIDDFPNDANETTDSDEDGVGDNSDAFPDDVNETHDDDDDGVGNNSDAFPQDPEETHDDDGDGVGNNTDVFPQDPDEQFDDDDDGVGNNEDDFPDNPYASNWATIYAAVGTLLALLIGAGVMISRMKKQDELPTVASSSELQRLDKQIEELQQKKNEMTGQEDVTEQMFNDD